ncbi:hypothetical protein [Aneurinibacillus thermoaerophilus]|uniref:hypothetical protein n=1 Tax=Aneurinibacillus thermoaerophilus TaxID=143495 RepID=UPI002E214499|nr:hypothetical protein [Aneurinibacillus thermoaerophilus]MED0735880.1 hypothetical protein [Aneurinibacillus thermoaerophilus]MED0766260.1 hypothetical protein [Aneurinibacillus thermoaerophilus]
MKAVAFSKYGSPNVLRAMEFDNPQAAAGEVGTVVTCRRRKEQEITHFSFRNASFVNPWIFIISNFFIT